MATSHIMGQRAAKGQEPYRLDIILQSITFYPHVLHDEALKPGRFTPYVSATIDQEKTTRKEMTNDIKNLDFGVLGGGAAQQQAGGMGATGATGMGGVGAGGALGGVTVPLNDTLAGLMWGPEDRELNVELWQDRTILPDRMVAMASMPLNYLLQMAQQNLGGAGGMQQGGLVGQQAGVGGLQQPGVAGGTSTASGTYGTGGVGMMQEQHGQLLLAQPFAFNLQPAERYAAKFNSIRQGGMGGVGTCGGTNVSGGTAGTLGQSATGVAGGPGANVPPGIARVVATVKLFQVRGGAAGPAAGGVQQGVIAPAGFAQYEFLQNLPAGSAGAGIETGPGAAQYFAQKQQATTTVSQGAAQPMQTGY